MNRSASFTRLQDSTQEDWDRLLPLEIEFANGLTDRILTHLKLLDADPNGFPVNRYAHSLQAATLALRDGRDAEYVVCALLHDIGDTIGGYNHQDVAAAVLRPFVSEENLWMVQHHAVFQGFHFFHHIGLDRHMRDGLKANPNFRRTAEFVDLYDSPAFDPSMDTPPIEDFEPMVRQVFAKPARSIYLQAF
jgi:predicted HD phosphohydrolase